MSVMGANCFIEGDDPGNWEARRFYWKDVDRYSTPISGNNYKLHRLISIELNRSRRR
jgi:hypothetical protein